MKTLTVCVCPGCVLNGAMDLVHTAQQLLELRASTCTPASFTLRTALPPKGLPAYHPSPALTIDNQPYTKATPDGLLAHLTELSSQ